MIKEVIEYHSYYKKKIETNEYRDYLKKREKEFEEMNHGPDMGDISIPFITFCDVLSNKDVTKLLNKLYKLDNKCFKCTHYYKKPSIKKKYNYVHLSNGSRSYGIFDEIEFIDDKYIKAIEICWSQINNYCAFLSYKINFKKSLKQEDIVDFVDCNIKNLSKKDYYSVFKIKDDDFWNFMSLQRYLYDRFIELCQHFITSFLYSKYGNICSLPYLVWHVCSKRFDTSKMIANNTSTAYYNKELNYIVFKEIGSYGYSAYSQNRRIPNFQLAGNVMKYGLSFYYSFFGQYELDLFNYQFSKYSSNERPMPHKELIYLLNRAQGFKEEINDENLLTTDFNEKWLYYVGNKKEKPNFKYDYFKKMYEESFRYFKEINDFYLARLNKWVSIIALVVSFLGLAIAILSIYFSYLFSCN